MPDAPLPLGRAAQRRVQAARAAAVAYEDRVGPAGVDPYQHAHEALLAAGVLTRTDARRAGVSPAALDRLARDGRAHREVTVQASGAVWVRWWPLGVPGA